MTARDENWKKHLLKSSAPLEHQAALELAEGGFSVSATFPYHRMDAGIDKECSVDLRGVKATESPNPLRPACVLDVLIECKSRARQCAWLFLPEARGLRIAISDAMQAVDLFSPQFVHGFASLNRELISVCYSAVEVGSNDGSADSKMRSPKAQLRHGVRQLQYALPALIALRSRWVALASPNENYPFFFLPILLTNAPLLVAHRDFGIESVERAKTVQELGTPVPCVIWAASLGPDFYLHCQRQLSALPVLAETKHIKAVEEVRRAAGVASWLQPSTVAKQITVDGAAAENIAEFDKVLVVNVNAFSDILHAATDAFIGYTKSLKTQPLIFDIS